MAETFHNPVTATDRLAAERAGSAAWLWRLPSTLLAAFARRAEIRKLTRELEAMSDHDLADIGISRADIPRVARGELRR